MTSIRSGIGADLLIVALHVVVAVCAIRLAWLADRWFLRMTQRRADWCLRCSRPLRGCSCR